VTLDLIDLRHRAPSAYELRKRAPESITTIVLHQMGVGHGLWSYDSPMWPRVRAHYVVRQDGSVLKLHDPTVRMLYGSGVANSYSITIEHEGNYPSEAGVWWKPETYGRDLVTDYPEQARASRQLIRSLVEEYPSITRVMAHRHISKGKPMCPGPGVWREVGEWSKRELGLAEAAPLPGGLPLPDLWREAPTVDWPSKVVEPTRREYDGPTEVAQGT
jgi:hypothetical protein